MLKLSNIALSFGSQRIFTDLSCEFSKGLHFISGQNGSGKTSLLNLIAGDLKADHGTITLNGSEIERSGIAYCRQFMADTFFTGSVNEEINYTLRYSGSLLSETQIWQNLEQLGLNRSLINDKSPFQLDITGQKLLSFVLALVKSSQIILLDETDSGLAFGYKKRVADFLRGFSDKIVIVISHDLWFINYLQAPVLHLKNADEYHRYKNGNSYLESLKLPSEQYSLLCLKDQIIKNLSEVDKRANHHSPLQNLH